MAQKTGFRLQFIEKQIRYIRSLNNFYRKNKKMSGETIDGASPTEINLSLKRNSKYQTVSEVSFMDSSQLQALLRSKVEKMPNKARRVVEYLLANAREAAFLSIGEVAEKLNVSKAQLVRVSRMVGFDGYAALKEALQDTVLEQVNPAALLGRIIKNIHNLPEEILRLEHANLDDTWNQLQPERIVAFCEMIKEARMVYCMGWGISSIVAEALFTVCWKWASQAP